MSGYTGDVLTAQGLSVDDRYVGKPFKPDELLSALSDVFDRRALTPSVA